MIYNINMKLTKQDYLAILKYYNIEILENTKLKEIRERAENILTTILCKCIKKESKNNNEEHYIDTCKKHILNNKDVKKGNFTCKNKVKFLGKKGKKKILNKFKKITHKSHK